MADGGVMRAFINECKAEGAKDERNRIAKLLESLEVRVTMSKYDDAELLTLSEWRELLEADE